MFTEKESNLANEASLTSSLLGDGLTSLRHATIYNKGLYYQAFFSLSIGIERLIKIIIINQYRAENDGEFLVNLDLKKLGHDLNKLCNYIGIKFEADSIHNKILSFLTDFAMYSRYYNIDNILDKTNNDDPLSVWYGITQDILKNIKNKKVIANKEVLASIFSEVTYINYTNLNGERITSVLELLNIEENIDNIQGYSVQYIYEIIAKLVNKINEIERNKYMMPVLSEFFYLYNNQFRPSAIREKKDWTK